MRFTVVGTEKRRERQDRYGQEINDGDHWWAMAAVSKGCPAMANGFCGQRMGLRETMNGVFGL